MVKRILIGIVALYLGVCLVVYLGQEVMIFHPVELAEEHSYEFVRPFNEVEIPVEEGLSLNAVHFTLKKSNGIVLFWHGNTGNVAICSPIVGQFLSRGYEALVVDYRGYGKSEGSRSQENLYADGLAVYDYLLNDFEESNIAVYGQSLGSGIATYIAAHRKPSTLILEAPYSSILEVAQSQYPILPVGLLLRFPMPTQDHIGKVPCPIYLFHGTDDEVIPYAQSEQLTAANDYATLFRLEGGGHNSCTLFKEYQDGLDEALLGYIREDQTEVVVRKRPKKRTPTSVRADSLKVYFERTAEHYDSDSLWLLYFRQFPREFDEFVALYGTGDSARYAPLREDAAIHLQLFFQEVELHPRIQAEGLFIGLASSASPLGGAVDDLRKGIQSAFLKNDEAYLSILSQEPKKVQEAFWTFYLDELLLAEGVQQDLLGRLKNNEDMRRLVENLILKRTNELERVEKSDSVQPNSLAASKIDTIVIDTIGGE